MAFEGTDKQKKFCQEYMVDLNATQAAIRAGYSENTAQVIGAENLTKPIISNFIAELKAKLAERTEISVDKLITELKNFAYSDITETLMLSAEELKALTPEVRRLISGYKRSTRTTVLDDGTKHIDEIVELKFVDKLKAIEMINKHIGFYEKDNDQKNIDAPVINVSYNGKQIDLSA
jgi:phage terminase small subunit